MHRASETKFSGDSSLSYGDLCNGIETRAHLPCILGRLTLTELLGAAVTVCVVVSYAVYPCDGALAHSDCRIVSLFFQWFGLDFESCRELTLSSLLCFTFVSQSAQIRKHSCGNQEATPCFTEINSDKFSVYFSLKRWGHLLVIYLHIL